jgi:cytochrome c556
MMAGIMQTRERIAVATRSVLAATCVAATCVAATCVVPMTCVAFAQEQETAPPKDTIFARKILMGSIDMNMDEIETMTTGGTTLNLAEGQDHADTVSIMLMAFPHMFPPSTNQWQPNVDRDPATDTYASPELWKNFADFYQRATVASKIAFDASRAKRVDDFKALIVQLRGACNACHKAYQKTDP